MAELGCYDKALECIEKEDYAQAKVFLEKALEEGEIEAYCDLGNLYFKGNGVEQDHKRAFDYYQKGAKAGEPYCMSNLGICYYWGHGVETDLQKSAFYSEKAAKAGVASAMFDTGLNYVYGFGVSQNIEKARYWLEKASDEGCADAFITLGDIYYAGEMVPKDLEKSFHYYQEAEREGLEISKLFLAGFYAEGNVVEKDLEKAKKLYQEAYDFLYEKATLNNDIEAQFRLGSMFFFGRSEIGMKTDYVQAAEWFLKAVENGLHQAENALGIMYYLGLGVGQSYEEAFKWFQKSAERKNVTAIANMGKCYLLGRGVEKDLKKAADCHSQAANLGYANSQGLLGEMYMKGEGVEKNYTKAVYWLKKGCENGERSAFAFLGDCYRKGLGIDADAKKAFELYQKGADMGDLQSKVSLAESLIEGWGTECDGEQAFRVLVDICSDEEEYRENQIMMTSHNDGNGHFFMEDPLDELNLKHYAKAYYLLGTLYHSGKGTGGANPTKAVAMLRMADRLGYEGDGAAPEELIGRIVDEAEKEDVHDVTDSYVEVREYEAKERVRMRKRGRGQKIKHEIYDVVLHHADGSESVVNFMGRNQFLYVLALMIAYEGKSVAPLSTAHFAYIREELADMAKALMVDTDSYEEWIDEFVYAEKDEAMDLRDSPGHKGQCYCTPSSSRYSNAYSGANRAIRNACKGDEFEMFRLRSTGGRYAVVGLALDPAQIVLPDSLGRYLDELPTHNEITGFKVDGYRWLSIKGKGEVKE